MSKIFGGTIYAMDKQLMIVETYLSVWLCVCVCAVNSGVVDCRG